MTSAPSYVAPHGLLKDKTVLVTAAAGAGIGFSAAKRAAEEGCKALYISDVHERRLAEAVEQIKKDTGLTQVFGKLCDVSKEEQVQALISEADSAMGGIDVLINNAGLGTSCKVVDMSDDEWGKVIDITLTGTFRMTRAALKVMQPRGKGVIVNNASVLGWRAQTEQAHYAAAKAGVMAFTRCSALEAAEYGVRINAVAPGNVRTPLTAAMGDRATAALAGLPIPINYQTGDQLLDPVDIANVLVFLVSPAAHGVNGNIMFVDGGTDALLNSEKVY